MTTQLYRTIIIVCASSTFLLSAPLFASEAIQENIQQIASSSAGGAGGGGIASVLAQYDASTRQKIMYCVMREQGCSACGEPAYYGDNVHFDCNTVFGLKGAILRCGPVCGLGR